MHLSVQARYNSDVTSVAAMLADERFVDAKVRASGAVSQQVDVVGTADGAFTVTSRRSMPTADIPAQFRSLVGGSLEVRQIEAWEPPEPGIRRGTVVMEITGAPVRLTGTMRLIPHDDGGTTMQVDCQLKASVPLFGAAVEQATAGAVRAAIDAEARTAAAWLAR